MSWKLTGCLQGAQHEIHRSHCKEWQCQVLTYHRMGAYCWLLSHFHWHTRCMCFFLADHTKIREEITFTDTHGMHLLLFLGRPFQVSLKAFSLTHTVYIVFFFWADHSKFLWKHFHWHTRYTSSFSGQIIPSFFKSIFTDAHGIHRLFFWADHSKYL